MSKNSVLITISDLRKDLEKLKNPQKAKILQSFFKTGKGEYGEGDIFLGVSVPESRKIAVKYKDLSFSEVKNLLKSKIHEERLIALLILVHNFSVHRKNASADKQKEVVDFYLKHTKYVNNWDLVDLSADKIVGEYLYKNSSNLLAKLARSKNIWERRIAIISSYAFIKRGKNQEALKISKILLNDKEDLIHKAVGWMLREVGKRCSQTEEKKFLKDHYKIMPRTMLRYAIEHFDPKLREKYLKGLVKDSSN